MKIALSQTGRAAVLVSTAVFLLALVLSGRAAHAQAAQFVGSQSIVISGLQNGSPAGVTIDTFGNIYYLTDTSVVKATPIIGGYKQTTVVSGLFSPTQVAVDKGGNLYVVEQQTSAQATTGLLYKETLFHGLYTQSTIPIPIKIPISVAVDSAGSIYVGGAYDGVLKLVPSGSTYIQSKIGSGLNNPRYLAVDTKGNVYAADTQNNRAIKETLSNGAYAQSVIGTGLNFPEGIAVDGAGTVYVSDSGNDRVVKLAPSGNTYVKSVVPINSSWIGNPQNPGSGPGGMVVDRDGNLLVGDTGYGRVIKWSPLGADFGQINAGTTSPVVSLIFKFSTGGNLYNIATLTQGMVQSDFAYSQTGTCFPGTFYFSNTTCSLDVKFTPKLAGDRDGAVLLHNSSLITFATGYLHGVGMGAQMQYFAANQKTVPFTNSGNSLPYGVAVDGYGTVYIADAQNNRVLREAPSGANYVESTVGTGLSTPTGVAVDPAGNVYIADMSNNRVLKETPSGIGWSQTVVGTGLYEPEGVAVGPDGSVYISDTLHSRILKETPSGNGYVQTTIPSNLLQPHGIAVDGRGNVYVADPTSSHVLKLTLSNGVYTQSILSSVSGIYGVAVDAMGNVYTALFNNGGVLKYTPSGNTYTNAFVPINAVASPYAIAVDGMGAPYVADIGNRQVAKASFGDAPSLKFSSTSVGSTSADSPKTVMVANYGNLPLNLTVPVSGENPNISTNFTNVNDSFHPCPITDANVGTPGVLPVGQSCVMYVSFVPTAAGNIAGSLVFTDDALNPTHPGTSHQTIALSGVGTQVTTQLSWPAPAAITYGTALSPTQLNAVATDGGANTVTGAFVYTPAAGTVLKPGSQALGVKFTPTNTAEYTAASKSVNLQVNKAVLTVTATAASKTYGAANPTFAYTITGFVNGETAATVVTGTPVLTTTAVTGSAAGTYPITPAIGTLAATNYTFKFVNGTLTVNKAGLTVTATAASKTYGSANPSFAYTVTGFVNGDTAATAVTGTPAVSSTAVTGSPVGSYPITPAVGTIAAANYNFKFVAGTLTVTKTNLTITANNASVAYNVAMPAFTYTPTGFVNGDTSAVLTGVPTETTTASFGSLPGTYPINIVAGTLAATNYSFTFKSGILTITTLGTVATPTFTPVAGTYTGAKDVTLTDATAGAAIHYTTDGTTPTATSATYTAAIHVAATTTIKAIAVKAGYSNSAVGSAAYTIN